MLQIPPGSWDVLLGNLGFQASRPLECCRLRKRTYHRKIYKFPSLLTLHCPINGPKGTCSWLFPGSGLLEGNKTKISGLGTSRAVAVPPLSHVLFLMKDKWGELGSLKLILLYLSICPCKKKPPSCCCRQLCVCLASGRAGMCRKAVISSWVSGSLGAGVERTAALLSHTCESFGEIQSPAGAT